MAVPLLTPDWLQIPGFPGADPLAGVLGGALIGLAASFTLLGLGRVAGVSGIAARAFGLSGEGMPRSMAVLFIIGLPVGAAILNLLTGRGAGSFPEWPFLLVAGVVVGFGTRLGSGCTSGHGVCGLSRLSPRSILSTLTFMLSGFITVGLLRSGGFL